MSKRVLAVVATAAGGLLLASCGGDSASAEEFCAIYNEADEALSGDMPDPAALADLPATMAELQAAAPDEISESVDYVVGIFEEMETMLGDNGLEFADLEAMSEGELPEGVEMSDMETMMTDMEELTTRLDSEEAQGHSDAVEAFTEENCGTES